jgi:hypothetical protein
MMTRVQRIEYEILNCVLNEAKHIGGYPTTVAMFLARLGRLFPDVGPQEFREACKCLVLQKAIEVNLPHISYKGADDDAEFLAAKMMLLKPTRFSRPYFRQLSALIELPASFKHHSGS